MLSDLVQRYEDERFPIEPVSGIGALSHLVESSGKTRATVAAEARLPESTLSEVLLGQPRLNTRHIAVRARYFRIGPGIFIDARAEYDPSRLRRVTQPAGSAARARAAAYLWESRTLTAGQHEVHLRHTETLAPVPRNPNGIPSRSRPGLKHNSATARRSVPATIARSSRERRPGTFGRIRARRHPPATRVRCASFRSHVQHFQRNDPTPIPNARPSPFPWCAKRPWAWIFDPFGVGATTTRNSPSHGALCAPSLRSPTHCQP